MSSQFQAPKGVSEYFPPRSNAFEYVVQTLTSPALAAGYEPIELRELLQRVIERERERAAMICHQYRDWQDNPAEAIATAILGK